MLPTPRGRGYYYLDNERVSVLDLYERVVRLEPALLEPDSRRVEQLRRQLNPHVVPGTSTVVTAYECRLVLEAHGHRVTTEPLT